MSALTLRVLDAPSDSGGLVVETVNPLEGKLVEPLVDEMDRASVWLTREMWADIDTALDRIGGALALEFGDGETFEGRFDGVSREQGGKRVTIASYELDAGGWSTTPSQLVYENVQDTTVIGDLIDGDGDELEDVTTLSLGTVEQIDLVNVSLPNRSRAAGVRTVAEETHADVYYDGTTVNYVARRGEDKSASVTLSPSNRNVLGDPEIVEDGQETAYTHVEGYGAGEGPDQLTYTATTDAWDGSGRRIVYAVEDPDIVQQDRLETIVDNIVAELNDAPDPLALRFDTREFDLEVGDEVTADIPDEGVESAVLRITERERTVDNRGDRVTLKLANRPYTDQDGDAMDRETLDRVRKGYGGVTVPYTWTSGWDHAGDNVPQMAHVRNWPDNIVDEIEVELHVDVREWRAPLDISEHTHPFDASHGHDTQPHDHGDIDVSHEHDSTMYVDDEPSITHDHEVPIDPTVPSASGDGAGVAQGFSLDDNGSSLTTVNVTETLSLPTVATEGAVGLVYCTVSALIRQESDLGKIGIISPQVTMTDLDRSDEFLNVEVDNVETTQSSVVAGVVTGSNLDGNDIEIEVEGDVGGEIDNVVEMHITTTAVLMSDHTHNIDDTTTSEITVMNSIIEHEEVIETTESEVVVVDSEIISETTEPDTGALAQIVTEFDGSTPPLPTDVEIAIDGQTVTTLAGDADNPWDATVDLTGELTPGDSQITALPTDGRGEINLTFTAEVFRKGRSSG